MTLSNAWTLWDLLKKPKRRAKVAPKPVQAAAPKAKPRVTKAQERYEQVTREMLAQYGVRVRKWRTSMSGVAWQVTYRDGTVSRLIESPKPKGPMSMSIFLHEIGHHAIGFGTYSPRCLEEYHAWKFSLDTMRSLGLNVTERVEQRMNDSLVYALEKALRRGLKRVPPEMVPYLAQAARHVPGVQITPKQLAPGPGSV